MLSTKQTMLEFYSLSCTKSFFVTPRTGSLGRLSPSCGSWRERWGCRRQAASIDSNLADFYSGKGTRLRRILTWEPRDKWFNIVKQEIQENNRLLSIKRNMLTVLVFILWRWVKISMQNGFFHYFPLSFIPILSTFFLSIIFRYNNNDNNHLSSPVT